MKPCSTVLWDLFLQQCSNVFNEWCLSDNPLAYDSLKAVLDYLKLNNKRWLLRYHQFRYSQLVFDEWSTTVDDTKYQLGIYQEYHNEEETPLSVRVHNSEGGYRQDIVEDV
ncbi:unnamed protein product [Caenorhabditis brenneri]